MRTFLVLICSFAVACAAGGAQKEDESKNSAPQKTQAQSGPHASGSYDQSRLIIGHSPDMGRTKGSQQVTTSSGRSSNTEREVMDKMMRAQHSTAPGGQLLSKPTFGEKLHSSLGASKTKGLQKVTTTGGGSVDAAAQKTTSQHQGKPTGGGMAGRPATFGSQSTGKFQKGQGAYAQPRGRKQKTQGDVMNSFQVIQKEMGGKVSPTPRPQ